MSDEIVHQAPTPTADLARVEVGVLSKANPNAGILRLARIVVQQTPEVSAIFTEAREGKHTAEWIKERLQPELDKFFPGDEDAVAEVSTFLADEYVQVGDSILLISSETGRALARITEDDLYQPPPVPRESGEMVTPAKRIRPEVEGFIVQWTFDRAHEQEQYGKILARVPQTQLLREEGDPRLLFTTRAGRRLLSTQINSALSTILQTCSGISKAFLDFFPLGKLVGAEAIEDIKALNTYRAPIQDPTARNLRYDVRSAALSSSATAWTRAAAFRLVTEAKPVGDPRTASEAIEGRQTGLWIASPNVLVAFKQAGALVRMMAVPHLPDDVAVYLSEPAGALDVNPDGYWCRTREVHDRWTVETEMTATLWVDWTKVQAVPLQGIQATGMATEVL